MSTRQRHEAVSVPDLRELAKLGPIHFIGIGGAGMSALAELIVRTGGTVTGCDSALGDSTQSLQALGVTLQQGHDAAHVEAAAAVVVTAAVPQDHPELQAARARGIPVLKRAQALGSIVNQGTVIAIAGTHGKTTTTTMTAAILADAELDPTALVGGRVADWGGGLRVGSDALFVVEADEYDRSFFALAPKVVVLTSVEADHLDIYGDLAGVEEAFQDFLATVPEDGTIVACHDDEGARRVAERCRQPVLWYGIAARQPLRAVNVQADGNKTRFVVIRGSEALGSVELNVPGEHNVRNALGAIGAALFLGADFRAVQRGLGRFAGVARRFTPLGEASGIQFIDDYAHHPTEISATLAAARAAYPEARLVAVFQPHLYSRTRDLATEFGRALSRADVVYVTGIYAAREQPIVGVTGELLADAARAAGARDVRYHETLASLEAALTSELGTGDICIAMGAGDIDGAARRVLAQLQEGAA